LFPALETPVSRLETKVSPAWNFSFLPMKQKFLLVETKVSIRRNYLGTLFGDSKNAVTVLSPLAVTL
jgi:hypothetical protein